MSREQRSCRSHIQDSLSRIAIAHRSLHAPLICAVVLLIGIVARGQMSTIPDQRQHYLDVARISTLEWRDAQPFLLKADFQLFDLDGKPAEKGTAEESWGTGLSNYVTFSSPSLPKGLANVSNRETYLVKQLISALARPFPHIASANNFKMDEITRDINGAPIQCFLVTSENLTPGAAFCADDQNRISAITGDLFIVRRSNFRKFHDHEVPMDLELSYEGKTALTMHVDELDEPTKASETPAKKSNPDATSIPGSVIAGFILKKKTPEYPKKARKKRMGGAVLLTAIISKQGTITSLDVVASPDPLFTQSAVDAVKTWTYKPYLLHGEPTEVDTAITVNYNIN